MRPRVEIRRSGVFLALHRSRRCEFSSARRSRPPAERSVARVCRPPFSALGEFRAQHRVAAGRQPVADGEALGQAQLLQLPYVELEPTLLLPEALGEVGSTDSGTLPDRRQHVVRPRTHAGHAGADRFELVCRGRASTQRDSRVRACKRHLDPVDVAVTGSETLKERCSRLLPSPPRIFVGDRPNEPHVAERDHAHDCSLPAAGSHPRPVPAAERQGDRSRRDPLELGASEQHRRSVGRVNGYWVSKRFGGLARRPRGSRKASPLQASVES